MPVRFIIQHKSGGLFVHPYKGKSNPSNQTRLDLHPDRHSRMEYEFDIVDGIWGYIRHVTSGKIVHPYKGQLHPKQGKHLVLHSDRHAGALWALDSNRNYIMHRGGLFVHPYTGSANPRKFEILVVHGDQHAAMEWRFLNPNDLSKEVNVYGEPELRGEWKIINMIINPKAEHIYNIQFKLGKSESDSTNESFEFTWETSAGAQGSFLSASTSTSFTHKVEKSHSSTWSAEVTYARQITVTPGKSVITWQFVFKGEQCSHKAVYGSNFLVDTEDPNDVPSIDDGQPRSLQESTIIQQVGPDGCPDQSMTEEAVKGEYPGNMTTPHAVTGSFLAARCRP